MWFVMILNEINFLIFLDSIRGGVVFESFSNALMANFLFSSLSLLLSQ